MRDKINLVLAQINPTVGDLGGNSDKIIELAKRSHTELAADIMVVPEQAIIGYPAEDLILQDELPSLCEQALNRIMHEIPPQLCLVVGYPRPVRDEPSANSAAYAANRHSNSEHRTNEPSANSAAYAAHRHSNSEHRTNEPTANPATYAAHTAPTTNTPAANQTPISLNSAKQPNSGNPATDQNPADENNLATIGSTPTTDSQSSSTEHSANNQDGQVSSTDQPAATHTASSTYPHGAANTNAQTATATNHNPPADKPAKLVTNHLEVCLGGRSIASYAKQILPTYQVFDEQRLFKAGTSSVTFQLKGVTFGVLICEDLWEPAPAAGCRAAGAEHIICLNASPYSVLQPQKRFATATKRAQENSLPISYVNCCGGQDELVFDGYSFVLNSCGEMVLLAPPLSEHLALLEIAPDADRPTSQARLTAKSGINLGSRAGLTELAAAQTQAAAAAHKSPAIQAEAHAESDAQPQFSAVRHAEQLNASTEYPAAPNAAPAPQENPEAAAVQADPDTNSPTGTAQTPPQLAAPAPQENPAVPQIPIATQNLAVSAQRALPKIAEIYAVLKCGIHDYVTKNGFSHCLLGLSGGIDSALVACLASDALGPAQVTAIMLPHKYTADISQEDARALVTNLGINYQSIAISPVIEALHTALAPLIDLSDPQETTTQNLQPRTRALLLMALANKHNALLLATCNKSESAVGYTTLYGDMAGGFAPLKDVFKQRVFELASYRNSLAQQQNQTPPIPSRIITRPPSAELYAAQEDTDNLPDYTTLDAILALYIEEQKELPQISKALSQAAGHAADATKATAGSTNGNKLEDTAPVTAAAANPAATSGIASTTGSTAETDLADAAHANASTTAATPTTASIAKLINLVDTSEYKRRQAPPGTRISEHGFGKDRRYPITNRFRTMRASQNTNTNHSHTARQNIQPRKQQPS